MRGRPAKPRRRVRMASTQVICPPCSKHLNPGKALAVGQRVRCSGCGSSFAVSPEQPAQAPLREGPLPDYLRPPAESALASAPLPDYLASAQTTAALGLPLTAFPSV